MSAKPRVKIRVVPRAGRTGIAGTRGDAVLVRLAAAPVDGAANEALIAYLASRLGIPRRAIAIVAGEKSRDKVVEIDGLTREQIEAALRASDILGR
jgi:uncharacterized protein (TIGR00251 family)